MPILQSFIGCADLISGGIIIGIINIIIKVFFIIKCYFNMFQSYHFSPTMNDYFFLFTNLPVYLKSSHIELQLSNRNLCFVIFILITAIHIIASFSFILGCKYKRIFLLLPHFCADFLNLTICIYRWFKFCTHLKNSNDSFDLWCVTTSMVLACYIFLITISVMQFVIKFVSDENNQLHDQGTAVLIANEQYPNISRDLPPAYSILQIYNAPPPYEAIKVNNYLQPEIYDEAPPTYSSVIANQISSIDLV